MSETKRLLGDESPANRPIEKIDEHLEDEDVEVGSSLGRSGQGETIFD